jgi:hypothetical protein
MKENRNDPQIRQIGQIFQKERNAHVSGGHMPINWIQGDARYR